MPCSFETRTVSLSTAPIPVCLYEMLELTYKISAPSNTCQNCFRRQSSMSSTPNSHLFTTHTNTPQPIAAEVIHHQTEPANPRTLQLTSDQSEPSYSSKERRIPSSSKATKSSPSCQRPISILATPQSPLLLNLSDRGRLVRRTRPLSQDASRLAIRGRNGPPRCVFSNRERHTIPPRPGGFFVTLARRWVPSPCRHSLTASQSSPRWPLPPSEPPPPPSRLILVAMPVPCRPIRSRRVLPRSARRSLFPVRRVPRASSNTPCTWPVSLRYSNLSIFVFSEPNCVVLIHDLELIEPPAVPPSM